MSNNQFQPTVLCTKVPEGVTAEVCAQWVNEVFPGVCFARVVGEQLSLENSAGDRLDQILINLQVNLPLLRKRTATKEQTK